MKTNNLHIKNINYPQSVRSLKILMIDAIRRRTALFIQFLFNQELLYVYVCVYVNQADTRGKLQRLYQTFYPINF